MPTGERYGVRGRCAGGFTYVFVLLLVAVLGVGLAATGQLWHTAMKRERERELLFIGREMRRALDMYYDSSPGIKRYPTSLEALVEDRRYPAVRRYLRRVYRDPMTATARWGLVKTADGSIVGVYSLSTEQPLKTDNFAPEEEAFTGKTKYSDWIFRAERDTTLSTSGSGSHTIEAWRPPRGSLVLTPLPRR